MKNLNAVIFDFDGVIHNTFDIAYKINKKINSVNSEEDFRSYFDGNLFGTMEKKKVNEELQRKFRELEREAFKKLKIDNQIKTEIEILSKSFDLHIISSNTSENLENYFIRSNFEGIFKEILATETHKSKVEKFKILFEKYNLTQNSCIFVTDTLGDILEANEVGVKSIACTFGFHDEERLKKGNPFKIVSDFKDIRKTLCDFEK